MVEVNRVVAEETYDQPQAVSGTTDNPLNAPYAGTSIIYVYSILYIRIPESMSVSDFCCRGRFKPSCCTG